MDSIFQNIKKILTSSILPTYDSFFEILNEASEVLDSERGKGFEYRPLASDRKPGSLLDFHEDQLPLLVVPDFHARPYFLLNILEYQIFDDSAEGGAATVLMPSLKAGSDFCVWGIFFIRKGEPGIAGWRLILSS